MSEEIIVKNCSPTLAGLKTASLFSCKFDNERELSTSLRSWNRLLSCKGVRLIPMRRNRDRVLVYVYRPEKLARDLSTKDSQRILTSCGYEDCSAQGALIELIRRLRTHEDFPHEIGLFLSYPPEDVRLFIENRAENYKFVGCWKVYGDEVEAKKTFAKFKKCTEVYSRLQAEGASVWRLTVAT